MYLEKCRIDGKIAVITGAARGIGFATADALSEAGATVVIADMDGEAAAKAAAKLAAKGRTADSCTLDVTAMAGWIFSSTTPASPSPTVRPRPWTTPPGTR